MFRSKQLKWIIAVIVLITTVGMVQKSLGNLIYLPVVFAPETQTPTLTPSPTVTITPSPTATSVGIKLVEVVNSLTDDPLDEYVRIYNYDSRTLYLTGWFIRDDGPNRYDFPDNFYIGGRQTVRIWTRYGVNTTTDLYWDNDTEVWNDKEDCAYLKDESDGERILIDIYCYSKINGVGLTVTSMPK